MLWPWSRIARLEAELADALDCLEEAAATIDNAERAIMILAEQVPGCTIVTFDEQTETLH